MMKTIEGYTYKINEHIGKGYSSTVHKGLNDKTGQNVSIKVIEMAKLQDPINQMLLQHQITALKKLSFSQGVLHLYDVYATKNNTYIVTQLCDGDLASLLKKRKNFAYHQSVEIIRQIINGYLDVYNAGYLHRDIKPANIFYKGNNYKIGDFGFAIPKKQLQEHKHYNVGSPVYMPPEALKDNIYSVSCDTWAIGIIFYQIIKGVVPWRAISEQKLHQKILTEPLDQLTTGLPDVARNFLSRVLHLDPKYRMTIQEMVSWPAQLAAVEIVNQGGLPSCSPLREIKNYSNVNPQINDLKPILTPKQPSANSFRYHPPPPPSQKNITSHGTLQYFSRPTSYPNQLQIPHGAHGTQNQGHQNMVINSQNPGTCPTPTSNAPSMCNFPTSTNLPVNSENQLKVIKTISVQSEENCFQQIHKYANNLLNYAIFLQEVVKFIGPPYLVQLNQLIDAISIHLTAQFENYHEYVKNPSSCPLQKWQSYLSSQKSSSFKTKLNQLFLKHRMFNMVPSSCPSNPKLNEQLIKQSIQKLLQKLENNETNNEKSIIALDYLTTFYQLWHLKIRHSVKQFLKMSKIDMIVEGNPYNVSVGHLAQVKRKLVLIDILG